MKGYRGEKVTPHRQKIRKRRASDLCNKELSNLLHGTKPQKFNPLGKLIQQIKCCLHYFQYYGNHAKQVKRTLLQEPSLQV